MLKKLFSHTAIYGIAPQVPKLASLIVLPIITPHLSKLDFGVYGLITAVVGAISVLNSLGLNVILSNTFVKNPHHYKWAWRQIYGFLILWNIPYAILLSILIFAFIPQEAVNHTIHIILLNALPVVLFGPTATLGQYYYQLSERPTQIAARSVAVGFLTIGLNLIFIAEFQMGYLGWFLSGAIGQFVLQVSYWFPLYYRLQLRPIFNFKRRYIRETLKVALPTIPHYYGPYLINMSDRLVMKAWGTSIDNIGLYNAANTLSSPFNILGIASGRAVSPMLLKAYKTNDESIVRQLIFTLQTCFLAGTFIVSIWIKEAFVLLIKNKELFEAYPLAVILIMAYSYRPMYLGANNRLFYHEKTKVLLKVTFIAGVGSLVLNVILIPVFGYEVAAYITFLALMYMGYSGYYLKEFKQTATVNFYPLSWLLCSVLLTILAYFIVEADWPIKLMISFAAAIFAGALVLKFNHRTAN